MVRAMRLPVCFPLRTLLAIFSIVLVPLLAASQPSQKPSTPVSTNTIHHLEVEEFEQFVPYWSTEGTWHSELQLRNNVSGQDLTVTPVLRSPDGVETILPAVTVRPQEVKTIDVGEAAPQIGNTYGSIVLRYRTAFSGALYASLMLHDRGHPISVHLDAIAADDTLQGLSREGIWWLPNDTANDYLVLTNQGGVSLKLTLSIFDSQGKESRQGLALGPRQTARYSVRQLVRSAGFSGSYGGIKVVAEKHAGTLDTVHFLFDEAAAFSALLKMFDRDPAAKIEQRDFARSGIWTLHAPMLALSQPDPALSFPEGATLHPQLLVRNTTASPLTATVRFNWRSPSAAAKTLGPSLHLAPLETRRVDIEALQLQNALPRQANWASVTLTTRGNPDELVAIATSYDATLRYGAQTPFSDQLSSRWEGGLWQYDVQHDSIITTGNGGSKAIKAAFTIFYNHGHDKYVLERTLQPEEQMWIDVGDLVRGRVPDKEGKVLPLDVTSGSYEIRDLSDPAVGNLFEGKVVYDKTYGHVTYGCAHCCGYVDAYLLNNPLGIPFQGGAPNGVEADDSCGDTVNVSGVFYGNWTTANPNIATVSANGGHTGLAVGATTSLTHGTLSSGGRTVCPLQERQPGGNDNVIKFQVQGNPFIFVGTDSNIVAANRYYASDGNNQLPQPSGGVFSATSSDAHDSVGTGSTGLPWVSFTTPDQSQNDSDRSLTFTYTVSGAGSVSRNMSVTSRQFAYLTNNSPSNTCTLGHGTKQTFTYTVFTHPDKMAVDANSGLSGTPIVETFDQTPQCLTHTGDGTLNGSGQFTDNLVYCSNVPLTCSETRTQTLKVAGVQVRTNTLQTSSNGISYSNGGPSQ